MAARKNKAPKTTPDAARAFVVVLEEIRAQNRGFGEGQQLLHEQQQKLYQEQQTMLRGQQTMLQEQQTMRQEQQTMRQEQQTMLHEQQKLRQEHQTLHQEQQTMLHEQQKLRQEHQKLHQEQQELRQDMLARFDHVEHDIAEIRHDVGLVKIAVLDHARELKEIRVALEKKVDRDEVEPIVQRVIARSR